MSCTAINAIPGTELANGHVVRNLVYGIADFVGVEDLQRVILPAAGSYAYCR